MFLLRILLHFCKILNRDENIEEFLRNSQYGCYGNVLYRAWLNRYKIGIKCFCKASKRLISMAFILPADVAVTYKVEFMAVLIYGLISSILQVITTPVITEDIISFFTELWKGIVGLYTLIEMLARNVASLRIILRIRLHPALCIG